MRGELVKLGELGKLYQGQGGARWHGGQGGRSDGGGGERGQCIKQHHRGETLKCPGRLGLGHRGEEGCTGGWCT